MKPVLVAVVLSLNLACAVALKAPAPAPTIQRIEASYGSSVMHFGEYDVKGVVSNTVGIGVALGGGRLAMQQQTVRFAVLRAGRVFTELSCGAGSSEPKLMMGSFSLNHPKYTVQCMGPDFSLVLSGDPEKPLTGVATWRGVRYPVKTSFDTAEKGKSPHLGFHIESDEGWLASSDIQGATWISTAMTPEAREAIVLANFGWASRRNVIMDGAGSGFMVLR